jgi:DNA-binding CsgD family transcriptional regulator
VALRPRARTRPFRVALRVADRVVRTRIARACADAGIAVANAGAARDGTGVDADIVVADQPVDTMAPMIALTSGEDDAWPGDVRAVVPADIDAATFAAVVTVVAAGLVVTPRNDLHEDDLPEDDLDEDELDEDELDEESAVGWPDPVDGAGDLPIVLTPRERDVLALLAEGASNKAIARALAVSVHTAKFHVASLTEKLGARGRLEAIAIAIRAGLVMV